MIFDNIKNTDLYLGLGENFKKGLETLKNTDLSALPLGKTYIDGDNLYANKSEYQTKTVIGDFEAHDKYADIQFIISGSERIDYAERKDCALTTEYNPVKDVIFMNTDKFFPLLISEGQFAIFFPEDAHRPNLANGESASVQKVVVKVKL